MMMIDVVISLAQSLYHDLTHTSSLALLFFALSLYSNCCYSDDDDDDRDADDVMMMIDVFHLTHSITHSLSHPFTSSHYLLPSHTYTLSLS